MGKNGRNSRSILLLGSQIIQKASNQCLNISLANLLASNLRILCSILLSNLRGSTQKSQPSKSSQAPTESNLTHPNTKLELTHKNSLRPQFLKGRIKKLKVMGSMMVSKEETTTFQ